MSRTEGLGQVWPAARCVTLALALALSLWWAIAATVPASAQAPGLAAETAAELSRYRIGAGLAPVEPDVESAAPFHARYLALNKDSAATDGLLVHTEQPSQPGYTPAGAAVAQVSNVSEGDLVAAEAVRGLIDAPLHRHWMLAPSLSRLGVGHEEGFWVLDLGSALRPWSGPPRVVAYPAPGQLGVPRTFPGHEVPNPLTAFPEIDPQATVGYSVSLHFFGCQPEEVEASLSAGDTLVPSLVVRPGTVLQARGGERAVPFVLLFARAPLQPATTYSPRIVATCGALGRQVYTWSFTTQAALDPAATQVAIGKPDEHGWQAVSLRLQDGAGLPADGVRFVSARWSYRLPRQGAPAPELRVERSQALGDGTLRLGFRLGAAPRAELDVKMLADGEARTVPLVVTPAGTGALANNQTVAPVRLDPAARAAWESAYGTAVVGSVSSALAAPAVVSSKAP